MNDSESHLLFDFEKELEVKPLAYAKPRKGGKLDMVCFYWLNRRCSKDQECDNIHIWDTSRMPICKYGMACKQSSKWKDVPCVMRHLDEEEKEECLNYRLGFCSFGPICEFRHTQIVPDSEISELWKPENSITERHRREIEKSGNTWRTSLCKFFAENPGSSSNWCPYFEQCKYAHNEVDLRRPGPQNFIANQGAVARNVAARGGPPQLQQQQQQQQQQVYPPCDPNAPDVGTLNRAYEANLLALRAQGMPDLSGVSGCFKFFIIFHC